MKKFFTILIMFMFFCVSTVNVFAAEGISKNPRVVDKADILNQSAEANLTTKLKNLSQKYNYDIAILTVKSCGGSTISSYANNFYSTKGYGIGKKADGVLFVLDMGNREWYILSSGACSTIISNSVAKSIGDEVSSKFSNKQYSEGFSKFVQILDSKFSKSSAIKSGNGNASNGNVTNGNPSSKDSNNNLNAQGQHVYTIADRAHLISKKQLEDLTVKFSEIQQRYNYDTGIVTIESSKGDTLQGFIQSYNQALGVGDSADHNGIIIVYNKENGQWLISGFGECANIFTQTVVEKINSQIKEQFSQKKYYEGFTTYIELVGKYIAESKPQSKELVDTTIKSEKQVYEERIRSIVIAMAISWGIALIVALISTGIMKSKLKSANIKVEANNYVNNSLSLSVSNESFLYKRVNKTKKPPKNQQSSSTRNSSSSNRSGAGGKF